MYSELVLLRAFATYLRVRWDAAREDESGGVAERVVLVALFVALAIAAGAIIYTKVIDTANNINLNGNSGAGANQPVIKRGRGEDGVAETVVIFPVAMVVILVLIQFALWAHAAQVVQAAAAQGDQVARAYGSTSAAGTAAARDLLDRLGSGVVAGAQVSSTATAGVAAVSVTGRAESILPGFSIPVSARSVGVIQAYLPSG